MTRRILTLATALLAGLLLCPSVVMAQGSPPTPPAVHTFFGSVTTHGSAAPDGTTVTARIGSLSWTTTTHGGEYGMEEPLFQVPAEDTGTPGKDGAEDGDVITFLVDGEEAATYAFQSGMATRLDLVVGATPAQYTLTVSANPAAGGSVSLDPSVSGNRYDAGSTVTLSATARSGYLFDHWSGDVPSGGESSNPLTVTMDADRSLTAHFNELAAQYQLSIASSDGGSVSTPGEGTFTRDAGETVSLVAGPDQGYRFDRWTGDVSTVADVSDPSTSIVMTGDKSITASCEEETARYRLTISSGPGGSVTAPGEGGFIYDEDERVSLTASPDEGFRFDGWTGDVGTVADTSAAATVITVNDDLTINASFSAVTPGITPASFSASNLLISAQEVAPGEPVDVSLTMLNSGGTTGSHTVVLFIDSLAEDSRTVTLAAGSSELVVFQLSRSSPGSYQLSVEGLTGSFSVASPVSPPPANGLGTPVIIGIIGGLAALIIAVIVVARRR